MCERAGPGACGLCRPSRRGEARAGPPRARGGILPRRRREGSPGRVSQAYKAGFAVGRGKFRGAVGQPGTRPPPFHPLPGDARLRGMPGGSGACGTRGRSRTARKVKNKIGENEALLWAGQGWAPGEIKEEKGGEATPQEGGLGARFAAHC